MGEFVKHLNESLSVAVEGAAALVVALAVFWALLRILPEFFKFRSRGAGEVMSTVLHSRLILGRWLTFALELTLAADILRTAAAPSWDEIGKLTAIAVLRTALNYFLEREIAQQERMNRAPEPESGG